MHPYGCLLHTFRVRAGLTQKALAEKIGILPNYLSQVEGGLKPAPKVEKQSLIEEVLLLSSKETECLRMAAQVSVNSFELGKDATPVEFEIAGVLSQNRQIQGDRFILIARLALEAHAGHKYPQEYLLM